jgi:nucleoside-diphosphate-sugar epimerase
MSILVTGATGFVGRQLCKTLQERGRVVKAVVRQYSHAQPILSEVLLPQVMSDVQSWRPLMHGCDTVVHLLARAHVLNEHQSDPLAAFRAVNTDVTLACAQAAALEGVRRFVFVSSIGVHGQVTHGQGFRVTDDLSPHSDYATSKLEAEYALKTVAQEHGMAWTIVRPPLVYGPGAPGNLSLMMRFLRMRVPLPFAKITSNRRSFVAVDNLCDLLCRCVDHAAARDQTFLVADGEDLSTADLLRRMGQAIGKPARLFPVPEAVLWAGAHALRKTTMAQSLLGNLQVDIEHTKQTLAWQPLLSLDEALRKLR